MRKKESNNGAITAQQLFRLPWTMADNAMTWLEPTRFCNISCDACFAQSDPDSQKTLNQIKSEIETLLKLRKCDAILIAGGEPLTHPQIVEITDLVKQFKVKPVIVTNGVTLGDKLVHELKQAGLHGITFHVDSHQSRPYWEGKNEKELNQLRQYFADMLFEEGNLVCSFNMTVFPDTLDYVPDVVDWAVQNIKKVHILSLIAVRTIDPDGDFDYYAGNMKIDMSEMAYSSYQNYKSLTSLDIYRQVKSILPDFRLCAFIGGTIFPDSLKWTLGCHVGYPGVSFGNIGAKSMELLQNFHHFTRGHYLAYSKPSLSRKGKPLLAFSLLDPELRKTARKYFSSLIRNPGLMLKRLYTQSINIMQPVDILPSGEVDICDGCPNKTLWQNRLVSSCRLDDYLKFGTALHSVPKREGK